MVSVDANKCIGCGACAATCPKGFKLEGGKAHVLDGDAECAKAAAAGCPVCAISA